MRHRLFHRHCIPVCLPCISRHLGYSSARYNKAPSCLGCMRSPLHWPFRRNRHRPLSRRIRERERLRPRIRQSPNRLRCRCAGQPCIARSLRCWRGLNNTVLACPARTPFRRLPSHFRSMKTSLMSLSRTRKLVWFGNHRPSRLAWRGGRARRAASRENEQFFSYWRVCSHRRRGMSIGCVRLFD